MLAMAMLLGAAASTQAAEPETTPLTPSHGPLAGGTIVSVPNPLPEVTFTSVSAGFEHSIAIGDDGNTYAWGANDRGQVGTGGLHSYYDSPMRVHTPEGVTFTKVEAGYNFSLALGSDGVVYGWGDNGSGQLGNGSSGISRSPVAAVMPEGVTFTNISAGKSLAAALGSDGNAYGWGLNTVGQVGDGTTTGRNTPTRIQTPSGVSYVDIEANGGFATAVGSDGNVYSWGGNVFGVFGNGTNGTTSVTPVRARVPAGVTLTSVSTTHQHVLATAIDGSVYAWGNNAQGQLGNGTYTTSYTPVKVLLPWYLEDVKFAEVFAGEKHSAARTTDGGVMSWGTNAEGQYGDGTVINGLRPMPATIPAEVSIEGFSGGGNHALALGSDHKLYAWGMNNRGQVGDFTKSNRTSPVQVGIVVQVTDVRFGGVQGTDITRQPDGSWTVKTPAYAQAGPVEVDVYWNMGRILQTPITYSDGFTYDPLPEAPTISGLTDQEVPAGNNATFTVEVTGQPAPTVEWEFSRDGELWESISADDAATVSADQLTLTVAATEAHNGYQYQAVARNSEGEAFTEAATLTVTAPIPSAPSISDPEDQVVTEGGSASFAVTASGMPVPSVAWQVSSNAGESWASTTTDAAASVSADGRTLTIAATLDHDGYQYRAVATNSEGEMTSAAATLAVSPAEQPPKITGLMDQTVVAGSEATFAIKVTGYPVPTVSWYVWRGDGGPEPISADSAATVSADGKTLTVAATEAHNGYRYQAVASNSQGGDETLPVTLTVTTPVPVVPTVSDPADQAVTEGEDATFTVTASGYPAPIVEWEVSRDQGDTWEPVSADSAATVSDGALTLIVAGTLDHDGYQYRARATNDQGIDISDPATLTVKREGGHDADGDADADPDDGSDAGADSDGGSDSDGGANSGGSSDSGGSSNSSANSEGGSGGGKADGGASDGSKPSDGSSLPTTGGESGLPLLGGAAALFMLGAVVFVVARVRRQRLNQ